MAPKSKKQKQAEKEAELARLAEEEAAEAARVAKEEAEEAALMAEELKVRQGAEKEVLDELNARLDDEFHTNESMYQERSRALTKELEAYFSQEQWSVFIACGEQPDVHHEPDVNTFLTEWGERPGWGADHLAKTMGECSLCVSLLRSLQLEASFAAARGEEKIASWQSEIQLRLKAEMEAKINGATADFLQRADEFADPKKGNECLACVAAEGCRFGVWVNLAKNPRIKAIEYAALNISTELPKALALASIAVRLVHYANDFVSPYASEEQRHASKYMSIGGVLDMALLNLPPPVKKLKGWTMRQGLVESTQGPVSRMPYPMPGADGSLPPPGTAPPLRISLQLDPSVILPPSIDTVGYWDAEKGDWAQDEISLVEFAPETRTLSFNTTCLTSLALLQETHLELPYKKWIYAPSSPVAGSLYLTTQRHELCIDVSAKGCTLVAPKLPELEALLGVPMAASKLMMRLRACGINLQPKDSDAARLHKIRPKDAKVESALHAALTDLIPGYQLAPSRWNQSRGPGKCTVRITQAQLDADEEASAADPYAVGLTDMPCLQYAEKRAVLISALDTDATFSEAPMKNAVAHTTPLECVKAVDDDAPSMLRSSSLLYLDTARQLLDEIRLFSFTAA